jgi:outer membrane protein
MKQIFFLVLVFWATFGIAQSARKVTLTDALALAKASNTPVKKSALDRQSLEFKIKEEQNVLYPQINAALDLDFFPLLPTQLIPGEFLNQPGTYIPVQFGQPWALAGGLNVQQLIYNESYRRGIPARGVGRALLDLLLEKTGEEVIFNTSMVFYQTLQSTELLRTVDANLEKLSKLQKIAKLQYENGYATTTDVKRITVAKTNLETQKQNLLDGIAALQNTLKFMCGLELTDEIILIENLQTPASDSLRWQAITLQTENTTEHKIVQKGMELLRIRIRALRAERYPNVSAYGATQYQSQRGNGNFFDGSGKWFGMVAVGFKVRVPVFDGFRRNNKSAQMDFDLLKLEEDKKLLNFAKNLDFTLAKRQFSTSLQSLTTQSENVALAKEIQEKLLLQYKEGIAPLTDLLNTQTALSEAETNYWQQVFTYKIAVLKLLKSAGALQEISSGQ